MTTLPEPALEIGSDAAPPGRAGGRDAAKTTVKTQFRFKITAEGFMLLLIIVLVGFAAWHSGANLLYLLFSILVAVYLLHGFLLSLNLHRLESEEDVPELAVARQPFEVTVRVKNEKRLLSSFAILVTHRTAERGLIGGGHFMHIPARSVRELTYQTTAPRRGIFVFESAAVGSRYPFGFEERSQVALRRREVLVLPQTFPVGGVALQAASGFGDQESTVRGTGTDLYGLREYVQGEPARHVHWRTSARAQKLMLAEYTREERRQVLLVLDNAAPQDQGQGPGASAGRADRLQMEAAFENAVTLTASLARHLVEGGFEVGLASQDAIIEPGQGGQHLTRILRRLALIKLINAAPLKGVGQALHIAFTTEQAQAARKVGTAVDSRQWEPPRNSQMAGEKTS